MRRIAIAALTVLALAAGPALEAKPLRWASQGDILTFDPHSQNEGLNNTANSYVYEPLIQYDEKFALVPTCVMNFAEGTRFTPAKHRAQGSPYRHLLKPKAGALALALNAMGEQFHSLLDVTIVYPGGAPDFWQFLCGDVRRIVVRVRQLPIPRDFCAGDYAEDAAFRSAFQDWLSQLWADKDREIGAVLQARGTG